jgi:hypothetical protein
MRRNKQTDGQIDMAKLTGALLQVLVEIAHKKTDRYHCREWVSNTRLQGSGGP